MDGFPTVTATQRRYGQKVVLESFDDQKSLAL